MTPAGGSIVLAEPAPAPASLPKTPASVNPSESSLSVVRMKLNGGNPWTDVQGLDPTGGVSNYLIGNDRKAWHTGIPHYERLRVARVYDGIDLVLYGRGRNLEYDFVVAPGADPKQIRVSFEGAKGMRIDSKTGDLVVTTASGSELRHVRPQCLPASWGSADRSDRRIQDDEWWAGRLYTGEVRSATRSSHRPHSCIHHFHDGKWGR
jgi:hypothetical protein